MPEPSLPLLLGLAALGGCLAGSFANVLIHRLPIMMRRAENPTALVGVRPFNLAWPASHCPFCAAPIRPLHNIPLLGYCLLGGRCARCRSPIPPRYPLVEAAAVVLFTLSAWRLGWSPQLPAVLFFLSAALAASVVDLERMLLPDELNFSLLWGGLTVNVLWQLFATPQAALLGALAGYLSLWLLYHAFLYSTGREGLGYGDFKLAAALGAWLGWEALPLCLGGAALASLLAILVHAWRQGYLDKNAPLPFGPFLALAGWLLLLAPPEWRTLGLYSL